jgi:hypothetical protein
MCRHTRKGGQAAKDRRNAITFDYLSSNKCGPQKVTVSKDERQFTANQMCRIIMCFTIGHHNYRLTSRYKWKTNKHVCIFSDQLMQLMLFHLPNVMLKE